MDGARWGIIGFGEVGSTFAGQLAARLRRPLSVMDPLLSREPIPEPMRARLAGIAVEIAPDIPSLVASCDVILSLVTAGVAPAVAAAAAPIRHGLFVDFNSISPGEKQRLAGLFAPGQYVDGAILGSIAGGAQVPLALSGPRAEEVCALLRALSFNAEFAGNEVGGASALKMCRSIFMKGIECLFVETLMAAERFKVTEPVVTSIEDSFATFGFRPLAEMLVTTHAAHCGRRADEMQQATLMLRQAGLPHLMSAASRDFLDSSARTGITAHFGGAVPAHAAEVITYLSDRQEEADS